MIADKRSLAGFGVVAPAVIQETDNLFISWEIAGWDVMVCFCWCTTFEYSMANSMANTWEKQIIHKTSIIYL